MKDDLVILSGWHLSKTQTTKIDRYLLNDPGLM